VAPAWVQHGSLMARSGGQFRANSAVMQRSSNRPASEPPPVFIEGSGCCERAPRPGPLMLVDGLKIGARDHARAVIPVSAISVVAGACNHRNRLALPSPWTLSSCRSPPDLVPEASHSPQGVRMRRESTWESRGNVGNGPGFPGAGAESSWLRTRTEKSGSPSTPCFSHDRVFAMLLS